MTPRPAPPDDAPDVALLVDGLTFPEGPRWHDDTLWYSDIRLGTVNRVRLDGASWVVARLEGGASGLGFLPDGSALVVSMFDKTIRRIVGDGTEVYADLGELPGDLVNDMLVTPDGFVYAGLRTRGMFPERAALAPEQAVDAIAVVRPDRAVDVAADGLLSPNGMVLTPGGRVVVAETYAQRVVAFTRRPDGTLGDRRLFADTPGSYPDGICLDDAGAIWLGSPYTDEFLRVAEGGRVLGRIAMPGGVACAFGGPQRSVLFLVGVDPRALPVPGAGTHARVDGLTLTEGRIGWTTPPRPGAGHQ